MTLLTINLLGRFQVQLADSPASGFSTDKTRALLAFLAAESNQPHRRQALTGLLWPNYPEQSARTSLRTALANLRQVIGDHQEQPPFLLITRQSIALNLESDVQVDVASFTRLLESNHMSQLNINQLEAAVELYRGKFLEGFSLADSSAFDDWLLIKREKLNLQMLSALDQLAMSYKNLGNHQNALKFIRRQVELEPWNEPAQRELMQLLALSGHRVEALAHYEAFRDLLSQDLGVDPEPTTTNLYMDIREGKLLESVSYPAFSADFSTALPSFLEQDAEQAIDRPSFVGRTHHLNILQNHLNAVLDGQGRVAFILGGAGRGKTHLVDEFVHRVLSKHSIAVAKGYCNAYSGGGDPYLPFRQVLGMLSGDVDDLWEAGQITKVQATCLWETLPHTGRAIVETGPDLIETFLPGLPLLERSAIAVRIDTDWLPRLSRLVNAKLTSQNPAELEQHALIEQYTQVLEQTSQQTPLLVILEDLHWADRGSIDLLLHFGRRLSRSRVLLLCVYRPDELASIGNRRPHPIEVMVNELRSLYGDIVIDLAIEDQTTSQQFVNDLIDLEPNRLREGFRQALHDHTHGHPLFTIEMLRMLAEQGDLVKDENDRWIVGQELAWDKVPARVEAVIQKRVDRLDPQSYELLSAASVEGEDFTAEIISQVLNKSLRQVLHTLAQDLGTKHRLLLERGEMISGKAQLSRFRFSHHLIQHYVYNQLSSGERRLLHEAVARAMEELFADDIESYVVQLAYHYSLAEVKDKTLFYLTQAGHQAQKRYDSQQSLHYFNEALAFETEPSPERFHLLAARAAAHSILAKREAQKADIDAMVSLAVKLGDQGLHCDALLALSDFYLATEFFNAREPALKAHTLAQKIGDPVREAHALRRLSWEGRLGADFQTSRAYLEQAAARFIDAGQPGEAADCLFMLARRLPLSAKHKIDLDVAEQAMDLSRDSGDFRLQAVARKNLAIAYTNQVRDIEALPLAEEALEMQRDSGDQREQCSTLDVIGVILSRLGRRNEAKAMFNRCLVLAEEIGSDWDILGAVFGFWNYWYILNGEYENFLAFIDGRIEYASTNERDWLVGFLLWIKAQTLAHLGQFEVALSIAKETSYQVTEADLVAHTFILQQSGSFKAQIGQYNEARGDLERALEIAEQTSDRYLLSYPLTETAKLALRENDQYMIRQGMDMMKIAVDVAAEENEERQWAEALDVRARLHLALDQPERAVADSSQVIQIMESNPWLRRPQNYLFTHHLTLSDLGLKTESHTYLQRAYQRVMFVAEKFAEIELRQSWLENVEVNREIICLWRDHH